MKKTASYHSLVDSLEGFLGKDGSSVKAAEEQGSTESPAPDVPGTDPEVKEILPEGSHERGSTPMNDITGKPGVPAGTPVPGQPSPPTEEPKKEETSPESKVASLGGIEKVEKGHDKFASILAELRGEEIAEPANPKTASEAATPSDAKSDPEIADLSGNGNGGTPPKNDEDTSGNPKSQEGAGSNSEPGCSMKEAGLSDEDIVTLTHKVARFIQDQQYASAMAGQLIENTFGVQVGGQKTASLAAQPTQEQKLAYAQLETRVNAKVAELVAQGLTRDQIAHRIQKIAMDEGAALVAGPAPEEAAPIQGGGEPQVSPEEVVVVLEQLVQTGEITPEEAVQAAQVIDEQLNGGGGGMPAPEMGGEGAPPAPPVEGGGGEGPPAPPQGGGEGPPSEGGKSEGGKSEGGESESDDEEDEDEDEDEESDSGDKKEAALKKAQAEYNRGLQIASLINQKIAENRGHGKVASNKKASAKKVDKLRNTKIALLKGQNATDESIAAFMSSIETQKRAGARVSQSNNPSIQDAFLAIDTLVDRGYITAKKAADALESLHAKGDVSQVAAIIKTAQALETVKKIAGAEPLPPEAGSAPPPPPAGPEGAPAPGPEGGAPAGDPTAAIDQLLGALEQLVMTGVIPEDKAVEMVQALGIAPPPGPEGAGGPPMPPAGPAAPAPGGEAPPAPPMA